MATSCLYSGKLYLYDNNLNYTGKSISTPPHPYSISFDSKGRFVVALSDNGISLYY
jgi:hypothetical protein